ncbi:Threonine synthase [Legionella massiliensis]|uniref:Threonine synthase n=1 Tax=Legionella massiliensis TaxID=1034943 RepID=A0A078KSP6_9GAMM|nr:threonine synthase [Legionella massiliensis]CDZ75982.1 Threonine synthase [Legionella massiliensis]CEE11720.1 Threonine synthase [Legionella massiliensis]
MYYLSTRNQAGLHSLSAALKMGLASDGGLFVPEHLPQVDSSLLAADLAYPEFACKLLQPFFKADRLAESLADYCKRAFHFPVPLKTLDTNSFVLELFHGPTSSFKDFGAHFLAECLNSLADCKRTIMVATSGDTGSAVASAFYRKQNYRAVILYPDGQVSAKQEKQMTCWDENIFAFAVQGNFDQCQQLVKSAFNEPYWRHSAGLSSANSINIGRLLPQLTYYAYTAVAFFRQYQTAPGFIIPSGNLGNATAAYWAKAMGFPIREIVMATNANRVLVDYLQNEHYQAQPSIATLANAMDVGNPSNLERLNHLFGSFADFKREVQAFSVGDESIRQAISETYTHYGYICCPHTATALAIRKQLTKQQPWVVVATADPSKFDDIIEPIIKTKVPIAPQLQRLLDRPNRIQRVKADLGKLKELLAITCG